MNNRNYGIDFLRILAMAMICFLHVSEVGGVIQETISAGLVSLFDCLCQCAVNVYAIISGYVGLESQWKIKKILKLYVMVFFYSNIITLVFAVLNYDSVGVTDIVKTLLPLTTGRYWYFSSYAVLFAIMPLLNNAVQFTEKRILKVSLLILLAITSILGTLSIGMDTFKLYFGYSPFWLVILYLIGAYLKKYESDFRWSSGSKKWFFVYLITEVCLWVFGKLLPNYVPVLKPLHFIYSYTSPFNVVASISLFMYFAGREFNKASENIIKILSPLTFAVYIIHVHPLIYANVLSGAFVELSEINEILSVVVTILISAGILIVCAGIEYIRQMIFKLLGINKLIDKISV